MSSPMSRSVHEDWQRTQRDLHVGMIPNVNALLMSDLTGVASTTTVADLTVRMPYALARMTLFDPDWYPDTNDPAHAFFAPPRRRRQGDDGREAGAREEPTMSRAPPMQPFLQILFTDRRMYFSALLKAIELAYRARGKLPTLIICDRTVYRLLAAAAEVVAEAEGGPPLSTSAVDDARRAGGNYWGEELVATIREAPALANILRLVLGRDGLSVTDYEVHAVGWYIKFLGRCHKQLDANEESSMAAAARGQVGPLAGDTRSSWLTTVTVGPPAADSINRPPSRTTAVPAAESAVGKDFQVADSATVSAPSGVGSTSRGREETPTTTADATREFPPAAAPIPVNEWLDGLPLRPPRSRRPTGSPQSRRSRRQRVQAAAAMARTAATSTAAASPTATTTDAAAGAAGSLTGQVDGGAGEIASTDATPAVHVKSDGESRVAATARRGALPPGEATPRAAHPDDNAALATPPSTTSPGREARRACPPDDRRARMAPVAAGRTRHRRGGSGGGGHNRGGGAIGGLRSAGSIDGAASVPTVVAHRPRTLPPLPLPASSLPLTDTERGDRRDRRSPAPPRGAGETSCPSRARQTPPGGRVGDTVAPRRGRRDDDAVSSSAGTSGTPMRGRHRPRDLPSGPPPLPPSSLPPSSTLLTQTSGLPPVSSLLPPAPPPPLTSPSPLPPPPPPSPRPPSPSPPVLAASFAPLARTNLPLTLQPSLTEPLLPVVHPVLGGGVSGRSRAHTSAWGDPLLDLSSAADHRSVATLHAAVPPQQPPSSGTPSAVHRAGPSPAPMYTTHATVPTEGFPLGERPVPEVAAWQGIPAAIDGTTPARQVTVDPRDRTTAATAEKTSPHIPVASSSWHSMAMLADRPPASWTPVVESPPPAETPPASAPLAGSRLSPPSMASGQWPTPTVSEAVVPTQATYSHSISSSKATETAAHSPQTPSTAGAGSSSSSAGAGVRGSRLMRLFPSARSTAPVVAPPEGPPLAAARPPTGEAASAAMAATAAAAEAAAVHAASPAAIPAASAARKPTRPSPTPPTVGAASLSPRVTSVPGSRLMRLFPSVGSPPPSVAPPAAEAAPSQEASPVAVPMGSTAGAPASPSCPIPSTTGRRGRSGGERQAGGHRKTRDGGDDDGGGRGC